VLGLDNIVEGEGFINFLTVRDLISRTTIRGCGNEGRRKKEEGRRFAGRRREAVYR
jgi:hypothetical protein